MQSIKSINAILSACFFIIFISGCQSISNMRKLYPGPDLPGEEVLIMAPSGIYFEAADGQKFQGTTQIRQLRMLPGEHTVVVRYQLVRSDVYGITSYVSPIKINTVKGHFYTINSLDYYTDGQNIYSEAYYNIANSEDKNSLRCQDTLNIKWKPKRSDWRAVPYVLDEGLRYHPLDKKQPERFIWLSDKQKKLYDTIRSQNSIALECLHKN